VNKPYTLRVIAVCGGTYDTHYDTKEDALEESNRLNRTEDWCASVYDEDGNEVF
jgi:hypothetical protein